MSAPASRQPSPVTRTSGTRPHRSPGPIAASALLLVLALAFATGTATTAAAAAPPGKRVFLEIADVHDYARVGLNGKQLDAHAWQPYRWDITNTLKSGSNELEVEVRASATGRGGAGAAAPSGGRGRGGTPPVSGLLGPVRMVVR